MASSGPNCVNYRLHVTMLVELMPGEVRQEIHRDGEIYPVHCSILGLYSHPAPPMTLAAFWAYTDFTKEKRSNSWCAPDLHRWPQERQPEDHELVQAVMPQGSMLLYTSSVWHGNEANQSDAVRTGMGLHYSLGWLRQEENQGALFTPEVARNFPERLQRLIGYDFEVRTSVLLSKVTPEIATTAFCATTTVTSLVHRTRTPKHSTREN